MKLLLKVDSQFLLSADASFASTGWVQLDMMNHYQIQVAEGMDALLVAACVCCIDEEFDEEHQKRREERE